MTRTDQRQGQRPTSRQTGKATYSGETGRNLNTRLTEHKWATKNGDIRDHISEHHRLTKTQNRLGLCWMRHLQHKLPTATDIRKLVHKLRTRTSEPMSTATCTLQTTHTWPQTKPTNNRWIENKSNSNRPITTTFMFWWPITSLQNWPIRTKTRDINTIIWWRLFTWLWRWLPLR